jgi:hypothetical protein
MALRTTVHALALCLLAAVSAHAATTITVTSNADAGANTLRQAIIDANDDLSPDPVTIAFAIGTGAVSIAPTTELPAILRAVVIDGTTQPGFDDTPLVEIRGDSMPDGFNGLFFHSHSGSTVRGLVINRFTHSTMTFNGGFGIDIASGSNDHLIAGNYLGTDATGAAAAANSRGGLQARGSNVTIGGTTAADRNVISGNGGRGVLFLAGTGSTVVGNYIGLDAAGTTAIPNLDGVDIFAPAADVTIGGTNAGERNVITSSSSGVAVFSAAGTTVRGNLIGTDASGTVLVADPGFSGVGLFAAGATAIELNVIGGTTSTGIFVQGGSHDVTILGNNIGVDASGTIALPLTGYGVAVQGDSPSPTDVTIGGISPGEGNVITNCTTGVQASGGTTFPMGVTVRGNGITGNSQLGIDIGATDNDADDSDDGPNGLQNFPVLTAAGASATDITIDGTLTSVASATYEVDFYASPSADPSGFGEGATYLGSVTVPIDGTGTATFGVTLPVVVTPGAVITATATDAGGNTSEFSAALTSTAATTTTTSSTSTTTSSTTTSSTTTSSTTTTLASTTTTSTTTTTVASTTTSSTTTSSTTTSSTTTSSTTTSTTTTSPTTTTTTSSTTTTVAPTTTTSTTSTSSTSSSTTITPATTSTTTTTLPCDITGVAKVSCVLGDLPPATCTGEALPKAVTKGLDASRTLLGKAASASPKAARRFEKQAAARLKKAAAKLTKAAKQSKVDAACADALGASLQEARALILELLAL